MDIDKKYVIYSCKEMEYIAKLLCKSNPANFTFETINWQHFPDGTPNIFINNIEKVKDENILFIASFSKAIHKFDQICAMLTLCESFIKSLTVLLPFFPTATMERVDVEGQVATARIDSWLFNSLPSPGPPIKVIIYDIHTLQNRFYIHGNSLPKLVTALPIFIDKLKKSHSNEKISIVFPDSGADKRNYRYFGKFYDIVICDKIRDGDKRIVKIKEGEEYVKNTHTFIVDDLAQSGSTLMECAITLMNAGATKVSAFVTHAVFPNETWKKFNNSIFEKFYITDTIPSTAIAVNNTPPFEVLSIYPNILEHL